MFLCAINNYVRNYFNVEDTTRTSGFDAIDSSGAYVRFSCEPSTVNPTWMYTASPMYFYNVFEFAIVTRMFSI